MSESGEEISPYHLLQEYLRKEPWRLLVTTICLNMCSARAARPVLDEVFRKWPTPEALRFDARDAEEILTDIEGTLRPLGLQRRRATNIWKMTFAFITSRPDLDPSQDVDDLPGIGKYGRDSFEIFFRGNVVGDVTDKELRNYVSWKKGKVS